MWNRRQWGLGAAAVASAAFAGWPVHGQSRPGRFKVVVAVAGRSSLSLLPFTLAERLGFFSIEGIDLQVRDWPTPAQAAQAVLSNEAQVFCGPFSSTLDWQARGQWLQSFVLQGRAPHMVFGVSRRSLVSYRSAQDLRGRTIGVTALNSGFHRVARMILQRAGLNESAVQFLPLPDSRLAVSALRSGRIDAICHGDLAMTELEQGGDLRVVADLRTLRGTTEFFGGPWASGCLSAPLAAVSAYAPQIQALANGLVHGLKWLQTAGPSDIIQAVPEWYFEGDRARYLAAFSRAREAWSPDGLMTVEAPATIARSLGALSDASGLARLNLAQTFTNEFARRAKAKFKA